MVAASVIALAGRSNQQLQTPGMAGSRCPEVGVGIRWPSPVLFLWPIGVLGWPVLLAGYVQLVRASGWGRRRLEVVGACLLACAPALAGTLVNYFHPEDLFAMGLILGALAAHLRRRWLLAGVLIGLACCAKQYAVLAVVPLLVVTPGRGRWRFGAGIIGISAVVLVPLGLVMGRGMWEAVLGTVATPASSTTFVAWLGLKGAAHLFVARGCPLVLAGAVALWALWRLKAAVLQPIVLMSLIASSLALRLVFEVNFFDYYLMALSVALIVIDVVDGTIRVETIGWVVAAGTLFPPRFEPIVLAVSRYPIPAQLLVAISGLLLAARPMWRATRAGPAISGPLEPAWPGDRGVAGASSSRLRMAGRD